MISVVIPTHNRCQVLRICLENLSCQAGVDFEVIVVGDGCTDDSEGATLTSRLQNVQFINQPKSHQGTVRNRGVEMATGDIILFIGDDILVEPGFLKKHLETHQAHPEENVVVLGYTTWDPTLKINDYMRFLESSGWQFGYSFLCPDFVERHDLYKFFYTSNISLKRSFFEREKFDEQFTVYGWEDVELGYRLFKNHGMKLFYEPKAKAYHHHLLTEADLPKKMQAIGKSAVYFQQLHPKTSVLPRGLKKGILKIATLSFVVPLGRLFGKVFYYKLRSWQEFFRQ